MRNHFFLIESISLCFCNKCDNGFAPLFILFPNNSSFVDFLEIR